MDSIEKIIGVILIILILLVVLFIISDISKSVFNTSGGLKNFLLKNIRSFFS
jgi:uncharacterized protein HemY